VISACRSGSSPSQPIFDFLTVPDHSGHLTGLCVKHYTSNPLYFNYLTRNYTAIKGNGTENKYALPCPLAKDEAYLRHTTKEIGEVKSLRPPRETQEHQIRGTWRT
jgi:hypothetical protein